MTMIFVSSMLSYCDYLGSNIFATLDFCILRLKISKKNSEFLGLEGLILLFLYVKKELDPKLKEEIFHCIF